MTIAATYKLMEPYCLKKKKKVPRSGGEPGIFLIFVYFLSQAAPKTTRLLRRPMEPYCLLRVPELQVLPIASAHCKSELRY